MAYVGPGDMKSNDLVCIYLRWSSDVNVWLCRMALEKGDRLCQYPYICR